MSRTRHTTVLAAIPLAVGALGHWFFSLHDQSLVGDTEPKTHILAKEVVRQALDLESLMASQLAASLATNAFLLAAVDESDADAAAQVLRDFCTLQQRCSAYDVDGDLVGSGGLTRTPAAPRSLPKDTSRADRASSTPVGGTSVQKMAALAPIFDGRETAGYVVVERWLDDGFLARLATLTNARLAFSKVATGASGTDKFMMAFSAAPPASILSTLEVTPAASEEGLTTSGNGELAAGAMIVTWLALLIVYSTRQGRAAKSFSQAVANAGTDAPSIAKLVPPQFDDPALVDLGAQVCALVARLGAREKQASAALVELETRFARLQDLLALDGGAFRMFYEKASALIGETFEQVTQLATAPIGDQPSLLASAFRHIHTLKADARLFQVQRVAALASELEAVLATARNLARPLDTQLPLAQQLIAAVARETEAYRDLRERLLGKLASQAESRNSQRLQWVASLIGRMVATFKNRRAGETRISHLLAESQDAIDSLGREDLLDYVVRYDRMVAELAQRTGKNIAPIVWLGNVRFFPYETMQLLNDAIVHSLRNAVDHGIEIPPRRKAANKDVVGKIHIESNVFGGLCVVRIRDDGRGPDGNSLARRAVTSGMLRQTVADHLSELEKFELAFVPGLSTASAGSEVSGHGVGMDAVRDVARQLGGDATLQKSALGGAEVQIHFPFPEARFHRQQSIFNACSELQSIVASLGIYLKRTILHVEAGGSIRSDRLVILDRALFHEVVRCIVLGLNSYAPKPCQIRLSLAHANDNASCSLDTIIIAASVAAADGTPLPAVVAAFDPWTDSNLAALMLEGGFYLDLAPGPSHEIRLIVSNASQLLIPKTIPVLALVRDPKYAISLFRTACAEQFAQISVIVHERLDDFLDGGYGRSGILVVDDDALLDDGLVTTLSQCREPNLIVVTQDLSRAPMIAILRATREPLLIEGSLNRAAVEQALEWALFRHFMASQEFPHSLPLRRAA